MAFDVRADARHARRVRAEGARDPERAAAGHPAAGARMPSRRRDLAVGDVADVPAARDAMVGVVAGAAREPRSRRAGADAGIAGSGAAPARSTAADRGHRGRGIGWTASLPLPADRVSYTGTRRSIRRRGSSHTPFAFWIVDALRPAVFVELGCHSGNSYASFAQAVQTLGLPTACYAVDTWLGDPHAGSFDESVFAEWSEYHERRFASFSRLIRATFDEALEHFSDGSHRSAAHRRLSHVRRGVARLRGVAPEDERPGRRAVPRHRRSREGLRRLAAVGARRRANIPRSQFRHGHGLGVLGVGRDLPERCSGCSPPMQTRRTRCACSSPVSAPR